MAFTTEKTCRLCGASYTGVDSARIVSDDVCYRCEKRASDSLKIQHFDKIDAMTIEQRIRRLEIKEYDNRTESSGAVPYDPHAIYG